MTEFLAIFLVYKTAAGLFCGLLWSNRAAKQPPQNQEASRDRLLRSIFSMPKDPKDKLAGPERQRFPKPHVVNVPWELEELNTVIRLLSKSVSQFKSRGLPPSQAADSPAAGPRLLRWRDPSATESASDTRARALEPCRCLSVGLSPRTGKTQPDNWHAYFIKEHFRLVLTDLKTSSFLIGDWHLDANIFNPVNVLLKVHCNH